MKIYLASSWKNVKDVQSFAEGLRELGHEVDDFTDSKSGRFVFSFSQISGVENMNAETALSELMVKRAFLEDKKWIDWSDCVLMLLPCGKSAHLEAGYAKGLNKKLVIYHLEEFPKGDFDVMYGFADLVTTDYLKVLDFFDGMEAKKP